MLCTTIYIQYLASNTNTKMAIRLGLFGLTYYSILISLLYFSLMSTPVLKRSITSNGVELSGFCNWKEKGEGGRNNQTFNRILYGWKIRTVRTKLYVPFSQNKIKIKYQSFSIWNQNAYLQYSSTVDERTYSSVRVEWNKYINKQNYTLGPRF